MPLSPNGLSHRRQGCSDGQAAVTEPDSPADCGGQLQDGRSDGCNHHQEGHLHPGTCRRQASAEEWVPELRKTVRQERHVAWSVLMHRADAVRAVALQLALGLEDIPSDAGVPGSPDIDNPEVKEVAITFISLSTATAQLTL